MSGGEISGNNASYGGGAYVDIGTFNMRGSATVVTDNEVSLVDGNNITVTGVMNSGSALNITPAKTDVGTNVVNVTSGETADNTCQSFFHLSPALTARGLGLKAEGTYLNITLAYTVTYDGNGHNRGTHYIAGNTFIITGNTHLYANWTTTPTPRPTGSDEGNTEDSFRVLFETNGGSFISPMTGLSYGDIIPAPPPPTKDGYTFKGWYTDDSLTKEWNFANGIPGDMTLYAKWIGRPNPTATPTVTASPTQEEPAIQPDDEPGDQKPQEADLPGFIRQHFTALIIGAIAVLLFLFLLLRRKIVTFLVPAATGVKEYQLRVFKNHTINPDWLPDEVRRYTWYLDAQITERWNFDEDIVVENITLYPGGEMHPAERAKSSHHRRSSSKEGAL